MKSVITNFEIIYEKLCILRVEGTVRIINVHIRGHKTSPRYLPLFGFVYNTEV